MSKTNEKVNATATQSGNGNGEETPPKKVGRPRKSAVQEQVDLEDVCMELRALQRQLTVNVKSRIMLSNRLTAVVASDVIGYSASLEDADRKKKFKEAADLIKMVDNGDQSHPLLARYPHAVATILAHLGAINQLHDQQKVYEGLLCRRAGQLPVIWWANRRELSGFGIKSLGTIVGEAGNLFQYSNPGKLWKRMGCAPFESQGITRQGSTWRRGNPSLSAEEWTEYGYSPRRRSVMYVISESLLKQNKSYLKRRYDSAKEIARKEHPEWVECECKGTGKNSRGKVCTRCQGKGEVTMHVHLHGMLMMSKLLLRDLWRVWHGQIRLHSDGTLLFDDLPDWRDKTWRCQCEQCVMRRAAV